MNATSFGFFKKRFDRQRAVFETKAGVTVEIHEEIKSLLYLSMVITIKKGASGQEIQKALSRLEKNKKKPSLKKHFGVLKRGLDGVKYQKEMRRED